MGRRSGRGFVDEFLHVVTVLPWWACLALAVVSYFLIHPFAVQPLATAVESAQIARTVISSGVRAAASIFQYLIPSLCLVGAGVSAFTRNQRTRLFEAGAAANGDAAIAAMDWREFEMLVGEAFRRQGYSIVERGANGADGGVDLVLSRPGRNGSERYFVQCKHWRALKVGVDVVREFYGAMAAEGAAGGYVVTGGRFTDPARAFVQGRNVKLIDGRDLYRLIASVKREAAKGESEVASRSATTGPAKPGSAPAMPACPTCGNPMVKRMASRGANAGRPFWGCPSYPACRGIRPLV
ncbi:MAG: restriction endonuclease [Proteobacteria bacterium]|nr:restriction endonuclease [Pseudomonadota bacterium]